MNETDREKFIMKFVESLKEIFSEYVQQHENEIILLTTDNLDSCAFFLSVIASFFRLMTISIISDLPVPPEIKERIFIQFVNSSLKDYNNTTFSNNTMH